MSYRHEMPNIAQIGALLGNPVRARIIGLLMDGSEQPAGALAMRLGASAQTASAHLSSLVASDTSQMIDLTNRSASAACHITVPWIRAAIVS